MVKFIEISDSLSPTIINVNEITTTDVRTALYINGNCPNLDELLSLLNEQNA